MSDELFSNEVSIDADDLLEDRNLILVSSQPRSYSGRVGDAEAEESFRFTLGAKNDFALSLNNLDANADVEIRDEGGNVILSSTRSGKADESIEGVLDTGTYSIHVFSVDESVTDYDLSLSVTPQIEGVTTTGSDTLFFAQTDESGPLIGMSDLRSDLRFTGVDGSGFSVAILDTGINLAHPFFGPDNNNDGVADRIVAGRDFVGDRPDPLDISDRDGHGSNVSSIAASSDNTFTGIAPGADIIHLRVLDDNGDGTSASIEQALQWFLGDEAGIPRIELYNIASINMSLSDRGNYDTPVSRHGLGDELQALVDRGVVVISASGNHFDYYGSQQGVGYPAADPNSLSIGAVWDADNGGPWGNDITTGPDRITSFSQRHETLTTVFAPGAFITGANANAMNPGTVDMAGTSQAAPHVAGMAALSQQLAEQTLGRRLTPDEFSHLLVSTGVTINDGDDEDDYVINTGLDFQRADMFALAEAISNSVVTVDTLEDENDGDLSPGDVSLREALDVVSPGGTILFDPNLFNSTPQTIDLNGEELVVNKDVVIDGPGADKLTINADGSRVFLVYDGDDITKNEVVIQGLTLSGGSEFGGGILNQENLTVLNSTISENYTSGPGAGIYNWDFATLTLENSTVAHNFAENTPFHGGGGIFNDREGLLTVKNSTISSNEVKYGSGGGISNKGFATVTDSTIAFNTAENHGGGMVNLGGEVYVGSSIVAKNMAGYEGNDVASPYGGRFTSFISEGYNLIGDGTGSVGFIHDVNHDIVGTIDDPINPLLRPLADYGGPTQTHALLNRAFDQMYRGGRADNFSLANGVERAHPSSGLIDRLQEIENQIPYQANVFPLMDFDEPDGNPPGERDINRVFAHTFSGLPQGTYQSASLEIRMKPNGELSSNDLIELSFTDDSGNRVHPGWQVEIGTLAGTSWTTGNIGSGQTFNLDLSNLSSGGTTIDLLPQLGQYEFLDVLVVDDTSVDYMKLIVRGDSYSPAVDAANPSYFPSTDQRGVSRPQGSAPDIGAYEFQVGGGDDGPENRSRTGSIDPLTEGGPDMAAYSAPNGMVAEPLLWSTQTPLVEVLADFEAGIGTIDRSDLSVDNVQPPMGVDSLAYGSIDPAGLADESRMAMTDLANESIF
ncbi:MAG: S8 family serine peptidase [Cyanobacteria bacterium SID2]|nr:S8 family serine peptidase [Cyanobacteria bacterium SID2]